MDTDNKSALFIKLNNFLSGRLGVVFGYLLLAIFFTFPLILNFTDSLPGGSSDAIGGIWYIWFFKNAIFDLHQSPLAQSDLMFYPAGFNISTGYDTLLVTIISLPLQLIFKNFFVIYNIIIIFNFVFSAYASYLLVKYLTEYKKISFLAGIMFGFSSYMLARSLGHLNLLTTGTIPLFVLLFLKSLKHPSLKNSLFLALSFLLVSLSSWQYGLFSIIFAAASLAFFLFTSKELILNKKYLINFAIFIILSAILVLPFALPMIEGQKNNKIYPPNNLEYVIFSADVIGYLSPTPLNTLFGKFIEKDYFSALSGNATESALFLGLLEFIFVIDFLTNRKNKYGKTIKENLYWLVLTLIFFILSLGPQLKIIGFWTPISLPFHFLYKYLPFFNFAKEPARMGIFVILFFIVIFSIFLKAHLKQKGKQINAILLLFALIIIAERIELPYQVKKIPLPSFYNEIAKEKNDYTILDLPANTRNSQQASYNFYQAFHKKKIAIGALSYTSFLSDSYSWIDKTDFVRESRCYGPEEKDLYSGKTKTDYDKNKTIQEFKDISIKYVIIHKNIIANLESHKFDCQRIKNNVSDMFRGAKPTFEDEIITAYRLY